MPSEGTVETVMKSKDMLAQRKAIEEKEAE
jgi:hypothetical protein